MPVASEVVRTLEEIRSLRSQRVEQLYLPEVEPRYSEALAGLPESVRQGLRTAGVERLWSHQVEALDRLSRGRHVLVTTPTASGKSLVFQLPVLQESVRGGPGRALFLFPLKALARDQLTHYERLARAAKTPAAAAVYDGDTPQEERQQVRRVPPRVLITNPDMLHSGILANAAEWMPFLADLRWIVVDELHTYRGIFGSHFHHLFQRLRRLCRAEGSEPQVIGSSATAVNAAEFAESLTGLTFDEIAASGSPREGRHLLFFQPEVSPYTTALQLLEEFLGQGLKTIVFTKARRITELLYQWLDRRDPELARRVASYRSGFLPEERRKIESALAAGRLDGVISTSALEMGIDIGGLDACILVGFPGSVMATWQRSGRVGRRGRESITALVALPDALDQYVVQHAEEFVHRPCEQLVVDPENSTVTRGHLVCAAAERPLHDEEDREYLLRHDEVVEELVEERELLRARSGVEYLAQRARPHRDVALRGGGGAAVILDRTRGEAIGTVDGTRVLRECHPGAIYLHAGRQYLVRQLDFNAGQVLCEPTDVDYFTTPQTQKETEILEELESFEWNTLSASLGRLRVRETVVGFERKQIASREVLSVHELELPEMSFETVGLWWRVPSQQQAWLEDEGVHFMGALHASEHAAISLIPLLAVCDRGDIGGISQPLHPEVGCGCVFVYDGHGGGAGITARVAPQLPELLTRVADLLSNCPCEDGCPLCIHSPKCGNGNRPLDKRGALLSLQLLLEGGGAEAKSTPSGSTSERPSTSELPF